MQSILKKLFLGNLSKVEKPEYNPVQKRIQKHQGDLEQQPPKRQRNRKNGSLVSFLFAIAFSGSLHQIFGVFDRIRISGLGFGFLCADESYIPFIDIDLRLAKLSLCHLDNDLCIA